MGSASNVTRMNELRHDLVSGRLVIVAEARATRPHTLAHGSRDEDLGAARCPFCPGHEDMTPPEIARTGDGTPGGPGWRVRTFPNLFPITPSHEVVVLSPDHQRAFGHLSDGEAAEVFTVLRDRVRTHLDDGHPFATAIVNQGRAAGASIAHPHAQVFALDFVPPEVAAAVDRQLATTDDLLDDDIARARDHDLVIADGEVAIWCPYASTAPLLVRVCHGAAGTRFDDATDTEVAAVAVMTRDALVALGRAVDDPPYNLVVHSAPRWYVEITPRLGVAAGFEQATGVSVNTLPPQRAAELLREPPR
jgi:UDPglucose--hexose-1-phosphate uridylyltransferase